MLQDPTAYGFLFLTAVAVLVIVVLLRTPARLLLRLFAFFWAVIALPFRLIGAMLRSVGLLPKASGIRHTGMLGASAWGLVFLAFRPRTELEVALAQVNGDET